LQPQVAQVLVCDPRRNALLKEGNKSDKIDARELADLLRTGTLVGSSQYMLGAFRPDTDLRRYGLRLCERGGKNAKKRAVVARWHESWPSCCITCG
jgi:hypothetical protein